MARGPIVKPPRPATATAMSAPLRTMCRSPSGTSDEPKQWHRLGTPRRIVRAIPMTNADNMAIASANPNDAVRADSMASSTAVSPTITATASGRRNRAGTGAMTPMVATSSLNAVWRRSFPNNATRKTTPSTQRCRREQRVEADQRRARLANLNQRLREFLRSPQALLLKRREQNVERSVSRDSLGGMASAPEADGGSQVGDSTGSIAA